MTDATPRPVRFADLGLRLASGLVLAAIALADLWAGGAWAAAFLIVVLALMLWEYHRMVTGSEAPTAPALVVRGGRGRGGAGRHRELGDADAASPCLAVGAAGGAGRLGGSGAAG